MKRICATMALSVGIAVLLPTIIEADYITPPLLLPRGAIIHYARIFAAPQAELLAVASCESSFNPRAVGDHGRARNIFQYHEETFHDFSKLFGETLDYNSYIDQAKLTAFIFARYPQYKRQWTCAKKEYKKPL